jgi:hypothetical protein
MDKDNGNWRKASYSNGQGDCVEVGNPTGSVAVRDTTDRAGGTLTFTAQVWQAFTDGLK